MTTSVFDVARNIRARRHEIDTLLQEAEKCQDTNDKLYTYLCRASCILIASHLEGFLKDLTSSVLLDFSYYSGSFRAMPDVMKRSFVRRIVFFEGVEEKEVEKRTKLLTSFFDRNTVPVEMDAFLYRETSHKNPSSAIIDNTLSKIGVPHAVYSLISTPLMNIFDNDNRNNIIMVRDMRRYQSYLYRFPYKVLPSPYNFDYNPAKGQANNTIWHTLLEEILMRRHSIAHGDTMGTISTHIEIKSDINKIDVFMHGIMYSATSYLSSRM